MIHGELLSDKNDLTEVFKIRKIVFVDELGIPEEKEFDEYDKIAVHGIVYNGSSNIETIATGRLIYDGETAKLDKIAVRREFRGCSYGDFLVKMLLNKAFLMGIKEVTLISELSVEGFFREIGFKRNGDSYFESNKEYCRMLIHNQDINRLCSTNRIK
jgi:predicted GNAT family N-acyltransferase